MNLTKIAAISVIAGLIIHIVCFATPHYAGGDPSRIKHKVQLISKQYESNGKNSDIPHKIKHSGLLDEGLVSYGLWQFCAKGQFQGSTIDFCYRWASETHINSNTLSGTVAFPSWIQGAQAMATIALLFNMISAVLAVIHMCVPSKGDRLRLMPVVIYIGCFIGGVAILLGDVIIGAKYSTITAFMTKGASNAPPSEIEDVFPYMFFLSWGFVLDVISAILFLLGGVLYVCVNRAAPPVTNFPGVQFKEVMSS